MKPIIFTKLGASILLSFICVGCGGESSSPTAPATTIPPIEEPETPERGEAATTPAKVEPSAEDRAAEELRRSGEAAEAEIMARAAGGFVGDPQQSDQSNTLPNDGDASSPADP